MNHSFLQELMPRTQAANQRIRDEQRAKILTSARSVFARRGLTATMAEVAAEAGVSQGLAYRYFASKDELYTALMREALLSSSLPELMSGTPAARLELLVSRLLEVRRDHPEFVQIFYRVLSDPPAQSDLLEAARKRVEMLTTVLRSLIVEGQSTGEVADGDPDQLVTVIFACVEGLSRLSLSDPERMRKRFPDTEIVLRMLRPPARRDGSRR
ncbi:MAG TPA: TetR/AcrR family transcriptional regulator [Candidatus Dormibacteraeota bacterium]|nr:TetR/AcrR family transcriptional regulator [Candidatus Dormibacteraeota bacterium]